MSDKSTLKIAVVDDSEFSRQSIIEVLENAGYTVVGNFSSGEEALTQYKACGANLFIIDVVMPDMSGIEVGKTITEKSMNTAIIMMSSLHSEHIVIEAISNGAIDFIQKPFEADDLLSSIEKVKKDMK